MNENDETQAEKSILEVEQERLDDVSRRLGEVAKQIDGLRAQADQLQSEQMQRLGRAGMLRELEQAAAVAASANGKEPARN